MDRIEQKLRELCIKLPIAAAPAANYVPALITGNQLFISGQLPLVDGKLQVSGTIGDGLSIKDGKKAARLCAINILAQVKAALDGSGGFERVERLVRLGGFVNAGPGFNDHHLVINGASDFMVEVLGDAGQHTRFAIGATGLPLGAAVEIDAIFLLKE